MRWRSVISARTKERMNGWLRSRSALWFCSRRTSARRLPLPRSGCGRCAVSLAAASGLGLRLLFRHGLTYSRCHCISGGGQAASDFVRNLCECPSRASELSRHSAEERLLPGEFLLFYHRALQDSFSTVSIHIETK